MSTIRTADINAFVAKRKSDIIVTRKARTIKVGRKVQVVPEERQRVSNGEINRELTTLKRMFNLAIQNEKLTRRPHISLLAEAPPRSGFLDREQLDAICRHLPSPIAPVIQCAYHTGWRIDSEILTLQWSNVDWKGRQLRLAAGTTKSGEPRVFPFTDELEDLLGRQRIEADRLKLQGRIVPWVFHRDGVRIKSFIKAWRTACRKAGCPGRIPHDLRRTAVRNLERAGVPRSVAMDMVGHQTESIYRRYAIVDETMRREAASKVNNHRL